MVLGGLAAGLSGCGKKAGTVDSAAAWWTLPELGDEAAGEDGSSDGEDEEDDEDVEPGAYFWGEAGIPDGGLDWGVLGFYVASSGGELVCELEYAIDAAEAAEDCADCTFAYTLTYGALDFMEGDAEVCERYGWSDLEGSRVSLGASGEVLWMKSGGYWVTAGDSELEGEDWSFGGLVE